MIRRTMIIVGLLVTVAIPATTEPASAAASNELRWLVLGDSYSSGEGLQGTLAGPDPSVRCAQGTGVGTDAKAWAPVAEPSIRAYEPRFSGSLNFQACSGQTTADLDRQLRFADEGSWDLVTMSFGGNNIGFGSVIMDCLLPKVWDLGEFNSNCGSDMDADLRARIDALTGNTSGASGFTGPNLPDTYEKLATHMNTGANVVVLGYPQVFADPDKDWSAFTKFLKTCETISAPDIRMLRGVTGYLNEQIALAVERANDGAEAQRRGIRFHFLDISKTYEPTGGPGHGACAKESWINGIAPLHLKTASFHPNKLGYENTGTALATFVREQKLTWPETGEQSILDRSPRPTDCGVRYLMFFDVELDNLAGEVPWREVPGSGIFHRTTTEDLTIALRGADGRLAPASREELSAELGKDDVNRRFLLCGPPDGVYRIEQAPPTRALPTGSVVTIEGIGPLRIGMELGEAEVALGYPFYVDHSPDYYDTSCMDGDIGSSDDGVTVIGGGDTIRRIDITASGIRTKSGIGIGSTEAEVYAAYGDHITSAQHEYVEGGHYLIYEPSDRKDRLLVFETDGSSVTQFRVGDGTFTLYVEGCA